MKQFIAWIKKLQSNIESFYYITRLNVFYVFCDNKNKTKQASSAAAFLNVFYSWNLFFFFI